jgi:hypothetical protein
MPVAMELSRIIITETSPQQVIFLKETGGERTFPIVIGISEALAIDRRLKGVAMPRPMTHDLLAQVIEAMGGRLERILITDLRDHTFIATLVISQNGRTLKIDARPSDAIALGVAFATPILVADHVLEEVTKESFDLEAQKEALQAKRAELAEQIGEIKERLEDPVFLSASDQDEQQALREQMSQFQSDLETIEEILRKLP